MRLISEMCEDIKVSEVVEEGQEKKLYVEGIFLQGAIKNRNGRMYPIEILDKEVTRYVNEEVAKRTAYGELGHPQSPTINLDRISHHIKSLKREGNNFIGKALVASTPMGNIAKGLISDGANLGVSSRGMGSIKPVNGLLEIQDDYKLVTAADFVSNPSGPNCYINGLMENVEWVWDEKHGYRAIQVAEQHKADIYKNYKSLTEAEMVRKFKQFLSVIGR